MEGFDSSSTLWLWIVRLPPLVLAITVHEVAHGLVAKRLGDPTAANAGRLTLNPIKHIDPIGTIIVPVFLYLFSPILLGWAKPVPVTFNLLRNPKRDMIWVAAAGPASNIAMATIWTGIIWALVESLLPISGITGELLYQMASFGILANVFLAVFNMVPIPPLDGGRVLAGLLPEPQAAILSRIEPFGILIVIGVLLLDFYTSLEIVVPYLLVPVSRVIGFFMNLAGVPY
jgi:Zn-dependent protease